MKIALGTDHAGYPLKEAVKALLTAAGHQVEDCGTHSAESVDYPDFIVPAARLVQTGECDRAVVFGGSGNGEAMAANRLRGVRCALCWNLETAALARRHNNANCLSLGARQVSKDEALKIVAVWLTEDFDGGRHLRRIEKLDAIDPD
ncbi:ribose 5-phosphate isomerase B [Alienimonas californiensis]|uniref:Ribose-5-phosphate isomerase B n=1 Tax=Alienimonas californiensis TaxID=2527989 RepID=A0A517PD15_9PLAN|nr:ribose 5-phosphate isomerase B [Alienimonas californiensis]QDT17274.1 Ribose-5-phosphate isomerase B [Alienimonas californiensis]